MPKEASEGLVRLQIPVDSDLARIIAELAERMEQSQSRVISELLQEVCNDRQRWFDWLMWRTGNLVFRVPVQGVWKAFKGMPRQPGEGTVMLRAYVKPEVAELIYKWGKEAGHSQANMAASLLACGVEDYGWIIRIVSSRLMKKALEPLKKHVQKKRKRNEKPKEQ